MVIKSLEVCDVEMGEDIIFVGLELL